MPVLDSELWDDGKADADSGRQAYVRVTDLEDGTARVQMNQCFPWPAVLRRQSDRAVGAADPFGDHPVQVHRTGMPDDRLIP